MWFKITLAKDGAVRSCEEVAHSFENSEHVLFIEAKSRAQAIERCRKIWKTRYRKRLYYEKKELGICTSCNEPALPGYSICEFHRARAQEANVKTYDKKRALGLTGNERVPENLDGRRQTTSRDDRCPSVWREPVRTVESANAAHRKGKLRAARRGEVLGVARRTDRRVPGEATELEGCIVTIIRAERERAGK